MASDKPYIEKSRTGDYHEAKIDYWAPYRTNMQLSSEAIDGGKSYKGSSTSYLEYYNVFTVKDCFPNQATASMWIKADITQNWVAFADFLTELGFGMYNGVAIIAAASNTNKRTVTNMSALWKAGQWNHVAVSIGSGINRCWINGVEGTYGNANYWTHTKDFYIGCRTNGNERGMFFTGLLDDFRFYNRCLEEAEILELYKTPVKFSAPGYACANTFMEGKAGNKIKKSPVVECSEIWEDIDPDYERLEYVENTGTQYIDTGISGDTVLRKVETYHYLTTSKDSQILFGNNQYYLFYREWDTTRPYYGAYAPGSGYIQTSILMSPGYTYSYVELRSDGTLEFLVEKDGVKQIKTGTHTNTYDNAYNHYLFGYNNNGSMGYNVPCRMYMFRVYGENNVLIRDFIPSRRKSDNAVGLYDSVNRVFYTNAGSGSFTAGPTITTGSIRLFKDGKIAARSIIEI